jgi:hypothetical protein
MVGIGIVDDVAGVGVGPPLRRWLIRGLLFSGDLAANGLKCSVAGEKVDTALDERLRWGAL